MRLITPILLACVLLFSCKKESPSLSNISWLEGSWLTELNGNQTNEVWKWQNDSLMTGYSVIKNGRDSTILETLEIAKKGGTLLFAANPKGQNQGQPVTFTLTGISDQRVTFENPAHDFPQKITYTNIGNDSLVAVVSGTVAEKQKDIIFSFVRIRK